MKNGCIKFGVNRIKTSGDMSTSKQIIKSTPSFLKGLQVDVLISVEVFIRLTPDSVHQFFISIQQTYPKDTFVSYFIPEL